MKPSFNLIDEAWIPCLDTEGKRVEVGIGRALVQAHGLAGLKDDSPLVTASLLRLLLAVLHAALDGPEDLKRWRALWKAGRWPEREVAAYLGKWRSRFDLFDAKQPFMQVAGFQIEGGTTPVTKLAHERATGNNPTLFDHSVEEWVRPLSAAQAARQLVCAQAYALGGGQSASSTTFGRHPNFTHGPLVGGVAVFLEGETLFETLALNLLADTYLPSQLQRRAKDRPTWEREKVAVPGPRAPSGHIEFLTWLARFVRLVPDGDGPAPGVRDMYYAQGWDADVEGPSNPAWAYAKRDKEGWIPVGLRAGRAIWRDSSALLAASREGQKQGKEGDFVRPRALDQAAELTQLDVLKPDRALRCVVVGLATERGKAAKPLLWREERVGIPAGLLRDDLAGKRIVKALQIAEEAEGSLASAIRVFRSALKDAVPEAREKAARAYWGALDPRFHAFLRGVAAGEGEPLEPWVNDVVTAARDAYQSATDNALRRAGRELEARVRGRAALERRLGPFRSGAAPGGTDGTD